MLRLLWHLAIEVEALNMLGPEIRLLFSINMLALLKKKFSISISSLKHSLLPPLFKIHLQWGNEDSDGHLCVMAPRSLPKSPYLLASGYSYHSATATFGQSQSLLESGYHKNLFSAQQSNGQQHISRINEWMRLIWISSMQ